MTPPAGLFRSHQTLRNVVSFTFDLLAAIGAFLGAYLIAYGYPDALAVPSFGQRLLGFVASSAVAFVVFASYRTSWRYVSVPDALAIVRGAGAGVVLYMAVAFLMIRADGVPRSFPPLAFVGLVFVQAGARFVYRVFVEHIRLSRSAVTVGGRAVPTVLLVGLSDRAESLIRASRRDRIFDVAGILDDSHSNHGRTIHGVRVLGGLERLDRILAAFARKGRPVSELIVTEVSPSRHRLAEIVGRGTAGSVKVSRLPDMTNMAALSKEDLLRAEPIQLADLLDRPEVKAGLDSGLELIRGKVVLTTGAAGSIGSELCRQIAGLGPSRLIMADHSEFMLYRCGTELRDRHPGLDLVSRVADVRDAARMDEIFAEFRPDLVFHAAALKHVPLMEDNPLEAVKTNLLGTRNVADAAMKNRAAAFIMISTDKAVRPTNIMGATKRAAEAYCQALDVESDFTRFKTVRFGNVLFSNGSVVPRFQQQIAAGGPVTVTHPKVERYFMTIQEAARLVLHASAHAPEDGTAHGKIMVLDMGKPVRILDLAERMIELAGLRPHVDIDIRFTGLRPGEKLYEELFDLAEAPEAGEGYVIASPRVIDRLLLARTIDEIALAARRGDGDGALRLLSHIVPEYRAGSEPMAEGAAPRGRPAGEGAAGGRDACDLVATDDSPPRKIH